ncbi:protein of unknown function [Methylocaldum szegediense]|uniref:Uncharacterized protein n=1 Tax=Methylocaldum szegediense TaxID=73780 RepID=A0ABM9I4X5_9GAMM|nr:protein of unknown function [Methylocaldum szegediense]
MRNEPHRCTANDAVHFVHHILLVEAGTEYVFRGVHKIFHVLAGALDILHFLCRRPVHSFCRLARISSCNQR